MLLEFGQANMFNKALQQPDKVKQVLVKSRTDGIFEALDSIHNKLITCLLVILMLELLLALDQV